MKCRPARQQTAKPQPRGPTLTLSPSSDSATPGPPPADGALQALDFRLERALQDVLQKFSEGPQQGVFTDGGCSGNPGPGGWGTIYVRKGQIIARRYGSETLTTNNRMELTALIAGYRMVHPEDKVTIWSDSQLCVNTINQWAAGWERKGWRRKGGAIKNLDLIQDLYFLAQSRPLATLCWVKAHNGSRWNEYVDVLATATLR